MVSNEAKSIGKYLPKKQIGVETDPILFTKAIDENYGYEKTNSKQRYEILKLYNGVISTQHRPTKSLDLSNTGCENDLGILIYLKEI